MPITGEYQYALATPCEEEQNRDICNTREDYNFWNIAVSSKVTIIIRTGNSSQGYADGTFKTKCHFAVVGPLYRPSLPLLHVSYFVAVSSVTFHIKMQINGVSDLCPIHMLPQIYPQASSRSDKHFKTPRAQQRIGLCLPSVRYPYVPLAPAPLP